MLRNRRFPRMNMRKGYKLKHKILNSIESSGSFLSSLNVRYTAGVLIRKTCVLFSNCQYLQFKTSEF